MNKLALVTGGIRGIGAAISIALKKAGYEVVANYRHERQIAESFTAEHGIKTLSWDVSNIEECEKFTKQIAEAGGKPISILVNNAGITKDAMMHKMELASWQRVIDVNLNSCFYMCVSVIEEMRKQEYGRIINISSVNALLGQVGQTNYSASKAAIIGFTKALARESAAKGITVNCVAPGYIITDMVKTVPDHIIERIVASVPVGRLGKPEEIARVVAFIAAEDSGYITGETFSINGGYYMS